MDGRALQRLKWRSRRGLLELDLVFDRFWAGAGASLDRRLREIVAGVPQPEACATYEIITLRGNCVLSSRNVFLLARSSAVG